MKVVCIDAKVRIGPVEVKEGKIYTAVKECSEGCCYSLTECSAFYNKDRFIPVSDIDETEYVTEEFEEKYCVPANK